MDTFSEPMLLKFQQNAFVEDWFNTKLDLRALLELTYDSEKAETREITFAGLQRRQFQEPLFETIRTLGGWEQTMPSATRVQIRREQPRLGRLVWIDVMFEVLLSAKVAVKSGPIAEVTARDLTAKLGGVSSLAELQTKLGTIYPPSVVEAFFQQLKITSVADFKRRGNLFLEFVYQAPPVFDPDDPGVGRSYNLNLCVRLQPELKLAETLQAAKLGRSILENERDFAERFEEGEILSPYVFVIVFPDNLFVDGAIPGLTGAQLKTRVRELFANEKILVHFQLMPITFP
jgi:hypothetical protein